MCRKLLTRIWHERLMYLCILPGFLYFVVFNYLPLLGKVIAFQDWTPFAAAKEGPIRGFLTGPWIGLENFRSMFSDPQFTLALENTIKIEILQLLIGFPAPIALALLLPSMISIKAKRAMQTIVYLPHFLSWVIVISIWRQFFSKTGLRLGIRQDV